MRLAANKFFAAVVLGATVFIAGITSGCATRQPYYNRPYYDRYGRDQHRWDRNEELAYRRYLAERRERYRRFQRLNQNRQNDYWKWRHERHDDHDRR
jgi:hypothetical protein